MTENLCLQRKQVDDCAADGVLFDSQVTVSCKLPEKSSKLVSHKLSKADANAQVAP